MRTSVTLCAFALSLSACADPAPVPVQAALTGLHPPVVLGPFAGATFADAFGMHGIGGDTVLIFVSQPSPSPTHAVGLRVARRLDGHPVAEVPPPPGGWGVPLAIKIESHQGNGLLTTQGSFVFMDAGVVPALAGTGPGHLYRYHYHYSPAAGFSAQLVAQATIPLISPQLIPAMFGPPPRPLPDGMFYPITLALLPDGSTAITDTLAGAVWLADPSLQQVRLAWFDERLRPGLQEQVNGIGRAPGGGTHPYAFQVPTQPGQPPTAPGAHSVAYATLTDELMVIRTASPGGIFGIPRAVLQDATVAPDQKSGAVREVVVPQAGVVDDTDGMDYDRFHPHSPWIYWHRAPADALNGFNTLRRAHILSGQIQSLASSLEVFDWTSELSALPPLLPHSPLTTIASAMGQEENDPDVNALLGGVPSYVGPSIVGITIVGSIE